MMWLRPIVFSFHTALIRPANVAAGLKLTQFYSMNELVTQHRYTTESNKSYDVPTFRFKLLKIYVQCLLGH